MSNLPSTSDDILACARSLIVAGYAAVGAFYFLVSAVWLSVSQSRRKAV